MSDRKTLIVYLKITYEKHWEKISVALLIFGCLAVAVAVTVLIVLLYQDHYNL